VKLLHRRKLEMAEVRTLMIPQRSPSDSLLANGLEQRTTEFLRLVYQEG
jgi:hypothetical protein